MIFFKFKSTGFPLPWNPFEPLYVPFWPVDAPFMRGPYSLLWDLGGPKVSQRGPQVVTLEATEGHRGT